MNLLNHPYSLRRFSICVFNVSFISSYIIGILLARYSDFGRKETYFKNNNEFHKAKTAVFETRGRALRQLITKVSEENIDSVFNFILKIKVFSFETFLIIYHTTHSHIP
jgi:hypothetical protein